MFSQATETRHRLWLIATLMVLVSACIDSRETQLSMSGIVYCSEGAPDNFNPQTGTTYTNFYASSKVIFNRLVETDNISGKILPSLALRWEISEDGLQYLFELRENVAFHTTDWFKPGRPLNADDVVFSFRRQAERSHPFHQTDNSDYSYFQSTGLKQNLKSVRPLDELKVLFELHQPDPGFLTSLSMEFASILSREYADYIQASGLAVSHFDRFPIGSGPFRFKKYQNNAFVRYTAHPHYMGGKLGVEHLVYAITPDASTRYARLVSGECDVMANPPKSQNELLNNNPAIQIFQKPGMNIGYLAFNTSRAPLDNIRIRRAIAMAIDKQRLVDNVFGNLGVVNNSLLPPSMAPYHNPELKTSDYNPQQARQILESIHTLPLTLELWSLPVQRSYNPNGLLMAELIQEDLQKVGITVRIVTYEWSTYLEKVKAGEHEMALLGWVADNYNASDFLNSLVGCDGIVSRTNRTGWCSSQLDDYLIKARSSRDEQQKTQLYYQAQAVIANQVPLIPIATGESVLVTGENVRDVELQTLGGISFTHVRKVPK